MKLNRKHIIASIISCIGLITVSFAGSFSDLTSEHWAYNVVNEMHSNGIISGFVDGTFKPDDPVTKEQFAALIFKILQPSEIGRISFDDVTEDYWSKPYVDVIGQYMEYQVENGSRYFEPANYMKRESVAMALIKALKLDESVANVALLDQFSDKGEIAQEAQCAIALCLENNIMNGHANGAFYPKQYLNRAEISALLNNVLKNMYQEDMGTIVNSDKITTMDLNVWNGTYKMGDIELNLYRSDLDKLTLSVSTVKDGSFRSSMSDLLLNSTEYLTEESHFFDDTTKWNLVQIPNGVQLNVSSTDGDSWLNEASGEYYKVSAEDLGWDGVYQNDDAVIILAQTGHSVYISINKGYSTIGKSCDNCSVSQLHYVDDFFDEVEAIMIVKEVNGIRVTSMSNEVDSVLNSISEVYKLVE